MRPRTFMELVQEGWIGVSLYPSPRTGGIVIADNMGFWPTRQEVSELFELIAVHYDQLSDEEIEAHNEALTQEYFGPKPKTAPQPKRRPAPIPGVVYLLKASEQGWYKIGRARDLPKRMKGLILPFTVEVYHVITVTDTVWAERYLHERFTDKRIDGEWFNLSADDVEWILSLTSLERNDDEQR